MPSIQEQIARWMGVSDKRQVLSYLFFGIFGLSLASSTLSDLALNGLGSIVQSSLGIDLNIYKVVLFLLISIPLFLMSSGALDVLMATFIKTKSEPRVEEPLKLDAASLSFKGLIVIMSFAKTEALANTPAAEAIKTHWREGQGALEHCWIICTDKELLEKAKEMIKLIINSTSNESRNDLNLINWDKNGIKKTLTIHYQTLTHSHSIKAARDNPKSTFDLINGIFANAASNFGLETKDIIADYTGGTKSMTAGMILACASPDHQIEVMLPKEYLDDGRADPNAGSDAYKVELKYKVKAVRT